MPTYEYVCRDCDTEFEVTQGFEDEPLARCADCGGQLRRQYGPVAVSFRGSGFYRNDS